VFAPVWVVIIDRPQIPVDIDTSVAHSASAYDYYLGGCFL
jgi:hypothetical protein